MSQSCECSSPRPTGARDGPPLGQTALVEALELGCTHAYVEVVAEQEALVSMFQDLGFEPEAILADFVRDGEGEFHDLMLLTHRAQDQVPVSQFLELSGAAREQGSAIVERFVDFAGRPFGCESTVKARLSCSSTGLEPTSRPGAPP